MSSEVSQLCLEALTPLAEQCAKSQETDTPLFIATRHFLKVRLQPPSCDGASGLHVWPMPLSLFQLVFDMLVLQKHNTEMTVAAGEALYTLVCLHQVRCGGPGTYAHCAHWQVALP